MDTNNIEVLVNSISDKLGMAATQLRPIADEVLRQYVVVYRRAAALNSRTVRYLWH